MSNVHIGVIEREEVLKDFLKVAIGELDRSSPHYKHERELLASDFRLCFFRGHTVWGLAVPIAGESAIISVSALTYQKSKPKNAWGQYINWQYAFTRTPYRYQNAASELQRHVERDAVERGYKRLKALAGSYAGVRMHYALGHQFWGLGKKGELVVDTPLVEQEWPTTVPIEARAGLLLHPEPLDEERILEYVAAERFQVDPRELDAWTRLQAAKELRRRGTLV